MRFIIETITGRKGIKNFSSLEEYVDFMTKNGDKIKNIVESDLPYDDKPVSVATPSQSNGWEQVNKATFGDVIKKAEKGDCVLPHKSASVFKDEAKFEPSKASDKADSQEGDVPQFKYDEPKQSSEPKEEKVESPKTEEPKSEEKPSEPKEEKSEEKDEKKKEQVDEGLGDKIHDLGVKAKQKLGIGLSGKELEDYINEYFVYVFMIANHQVKPNHPGFEKIAEKLIKTDSKMENVHDVVMSILEDKYYMNGFPADTIEDLLKRRLSGLGIDESIIEKAYNTFVEEEKNKDDGSFDDEIEEALRIAGIQLNEAEDDVKEDVNNPEDGEVDEKSGKEKLFEEGDDEELTLEKAKENLAYWKDQLLIVDNGDDFAYSNGKHDRVQRQVDYWNNKVKELSSSPKEDPFAALFAHNAAFMKNNNFEHNVGEKLRNIDTNEIYKIKSVSKDTKTGETEYVLRNEETYEDITVYDDELKDEYKPL